MASGSSVKVAVRVRPLNQREKNVNSNVIVGMEGKQTTLETIRYSNVDSGQGQEKNKTKPKRFVYDYSYWSADPNDRHYVSQTQVFKDLGVLVLDAAFEGYNACVFAYGQTGAGKTYTMMGEKDDPGLVPRICEGLYNHISSNSNNQESFRIEVSYLEIYNEQVLDLLRSPSHDTKHNPPVRLKVREHPKEGPYVQGLTKYDAPDYTSVESFLNQGNYLRKTAATKMNDQSSRSHAIFTIKFTQAKFVAGLPSEITSKIHLVDLAGSERVSKSGATGERLKEGGNINKSLTTLGIVISTLAERSCQTDPTQRKLFIPYRDSILTWLLKDSLGGNSKTIMIAAISPSDTSYGETLSTLRYADRAKNIINAPTVNEDPNVKLIRELKTEIERLKSIIAGDQRQIHSSIAITDVDQAQKLLEGTESKMERHLRNWTDKWRDTLHIIEESDLGLHKNRSTLRIDMDPPHLVLLDDDVLNTSITIFSLNEGDNLIGNINATKEQDLVFDKDDIKNEHCVVAYQNSKVMLTPRNGACQVNQRLVNESIKLSQGDIISLGQDIRLKFNFPEEASILREKRKSGIFSVGELQRFSPISSTPVKLETSLRDRTLSPVTDESGVELDMSEDGECEKTRMDELKKQVEDLLAKYKESEIERLEAETRNKVALEEKEKEIQSQATGHLELQKNNETLLQQHQRDLQALREQLSDEKQDIRLELTQQMEEVFGKFKFTNKEIVDGSRRDFEKYKKSFYEQLKRSWMKLDQYEMKLIEIEAEKRKTLQEAETRLKTEKTRSEEDRQHRFEDIEDEKKNLQEVLEGHLQELECSTNDYEEKERDVDKCVEKLEKGIGTLVREMRELEWLQYKLCREEGEIMEEDVQSEVVQTVKVLTKDIRGLESDHEQNKEKLVATEAELCERDRILKSCEANVGSSKCEMVDVRRRFVECQQRFGEQLGDMVNCINTERDAELEKIESDREVLLSKHLEQQRALEVLVNEGLERMGEENEPKMSEIKERVGYLVRCSSPGLQRNSLQSQIVDKKVQVHHQQMDLGESERERRTLHNEEDEFIAKNQEVQHKREREQKELIGKIKAMQLLAEQQGEEATVDYFELESSSLMQAQGYIVGMDKELTGKIRERRGIEEQIENAKLQMELQAESSQEQFHGALEELQRRAKEKEREIGEMRRSLQEKTDKYLERLRNESFVVLESPIKALNYMKIGNDAVDEILKEIAMASHVPELAETYKSMMQDCGGWRYENKEREVDLLKKDTNEALHCFLGRGIIRASPHTIVKEVSNPASRFIYDRMLKNIRIIENISDDLKIVYMLHETARCFIKYSRDFCFVALNREKDGKLIVACQSVDHTSCPEVKGVLRAKILSCGWVVEPISIGGQACSLVWYLTRVYLGKSIPSKLVNLVSKRQPLCVAYLRDYLVPGTMRN